MLQKLNTHGPVTARAKNGKQLLGADCATMRTAASPLQQNGYIICAQKQAPTESRCSVRLSTHLHENRETTHGTTSVLNSSSVRVPPMYKSAGRMTVQTRLSRPLLFGLDIPDSGQPCGALLAGTPRGLSAAWNCSAATNAGST